MRWRYYGISEEAAKEADKLLKALGPLVEGVPLATLSTVFRKLEFQAGELKNRTPEYRKNYLSEE